MDFKTQLEKKLSQRQISKPTEDSKGPRTEIPLPPFVPRAEGPAFVSDIKNQPLADNKPVQGLKARPSCRVLTDNKVDANANNNIDPDNNTTNVYVLSCFNCWNK